MKVLIYTKIEGNTAGDQTLLFIVANPIIAGLPEGAIVNLLLAYDKVSGSRAKKIKEMWEKIQKIPGATVWLNEVGSKEKERGGSKITEGTALLSQCIPSNSPSWREITNFIKGTGGKKNPPLDLFIIAGWSHQLNESSVDHIYKQMKVPSVTRILLCSPPGGYIDQGNFKTKLMELYDNVCCLQFGIYAQGGLPLSSSLLEDTEASHYREDWLSHISSIATDFKLNKEDVTQGDKLIVIYCSKDKPGTTGIDFIEEIAKEKGKKINNYPVLLIGSLDDKGTGSDNYQDWKNLCEDYGVHSVYPLPRTQNSRILMQGLRNAEYSMATGSFSILEAKALGIHHCQYLCPPHMITFGKILKDAKPEEIEAAFKRGKDALEELKYLSQKEFVPRITFHKTALKDQFEELRQREILAYGYHHTEAFNHPEQAQQSSSKPITSVHKGKLSPLQDIAITTNIRVEHGQALFISGSSDSLGEWKSAIRMEYKDDHWEFKGPVPLGSEFKLLIGRYDGKERRPVGCLKWEQDSNRTLDSLSIEITYANFTSNEDSTTSEFSPPDIETLQPFSSSSSGAVSFFKSSPSVSKFRKGNPKSFKESNLGQQDEEEELQQAIEASIVLSKEEKSSLISTSEFLEKLDSATDYGKPEDFEIIIEYIEDNELFLNLTGKYKQTALHAAVLHNHTILVEFLLERGADTTITDINGLLPHEIVSNRGREAAGLVRIVHEQQIRTPKL
jgi:Ankyrin repeats (many copies)/Starch binding domain